MSLRSLLVLSAVLAALALPATPAFAGEDGGGGGGDSATLTASQGCVTGQRTKAAVTGDNIDRVAFYVDGTLRKTVTRANAQGRYAFSMNCARLSVGAHRASAVVSFTEGGRQTLRFQITRAARVSPRYTG